MSKQTIHKTGAMHLTTDPLSVPVGPQGRAVIIATVPFICDGALHCADVGHLVFSKRPVISVYASRTEGHFRVRGA